MLRLLALGLSNHEISARSQIALSTAKWHLKNVFAKLDVSTRTGAIARAQGDEVDRVNWETLDAIADSVNPVLGIIALVWPWPRWRSFRGVRRARTRR